MLGRDVFLWVIVYPFSMLFLPPVFWPVTWMPQYFNSAVHISTNNTNNGVMLQVLRAWNTSGFIGQLQQDVKSYVMFWKARCSSCTLTVSLFCVILIGERCCYILPVYKTNLVALVVHKTHCVTMKYCIVVHMHYTFFFNAYTGGDNVQCVLCSV